MMLQDIQTGGLAKAFILKRQAKGTAIFLKGRHLVCETSENTVSLWETANRMQHPTAWEIFWGNSPCWLAPKH